MSFKASIMEHGHFQTHYNQIMQNSTEMVTDNLAIITIYSMHLRLQGVLI